MACLNVYLPVEQCLFGSNLLIHIANANKGIRKKKKKSTETPAGFFQYVKLDDS